MPITVQKFKELNKDGSYLKTQSRGHSLAIYILVVFFYQLPQIGVIVLDQWERTISLSNAVCLVCLFSETQNTRIIFDSLTILWFFIWNLKKCRLNRKLFRLHWFQGFQKYRNPNLRIILIFPCQWYPKFFQLILSIFISYQASYIFKMQVFQYFICKGDMQI